MPDSPMICGLRLFLLRMSAVVRKELRQLSRDRMTFGMVIMIPLIQLFLFGYAINTNVRHIPIAVVDQSQTALSRILQQMVAVTQVVDIKAHYIQVPDAENALRQGKVRAVLVLPPDLERRYNDYVQTPQHFALSTQNTVQPIGQWLVDGSDLMVASAVRQLRNMSLAELQNQNPNLQVPVFAVAQYYNPEQRSAVNVVPGLTAIILTMTMIMFTSAAIVRERERGNMELLINTPIRPLELMLGKIIPYILVGLIQVMIVLGLGHWIFDVPITGPAYAIFLSSLLFICASLTLGLIISTLAKTQLQSMQMTVFILLPSILLSGFMFSFEGMPRPAQWIAEVLPATHFIRVIRAVVLRDAGLWDMRFELLWLAIFFIVGLLIATRRFRKTLD
ncbi:MAG: ABC transporter permease [Plesiomonas shigelloides]